jgi:hypothetical protein
MKPSVVPSCAAVAAIDAGEWREKAFTPPQTMPIFSLG